MCVCVEARFYIVICIVLMFLRFCLCAEHDVLILACDGLWDVVSDREAAIVALNTDDAGLAAKRLRDLAFARGSDDNISVLVVRLRAGKGMSS